MLKESIRKVMNSQLIAIAYAEPEQYTISQEELIAQLSKNYVKRHQVITEAFYKVFLADMPEEKELLEGFREGKAKGEFIRGIIFDQDGFQQPTPGLYLYFAYATGQDWDVDLFHLTDEENAFAITMREIRTYVNNCLEANFSDRPHLEELREGLVGRTAEDIVQVCLQNQVKVNMYLEFKDDWSYFPAVLRQALKGENNGKVYLGRSHKSNQTPPKKKRRK